MSKTIDKTTEMTELKWLKNGYVLKKGAEGRLVYYQKIREYIRLYSRSEVVHREDWAKARLRKIQNKKNKKAREQYIKDKAAKQLRSKQYQIVLIKVPCQRFDYQWEEYYNDWNVYEYIADSTEQFESLEIGQEITVQTSNGTEMTGTVHIKRIDTLKYRNEIYFAYKYRTIDGHLVPEYTYKDYQKAIQRVKDGINRKRRKQRLKQKDQV
ncbi:TPA: hypothetical protein ACGOSD_002126 [Streptococcus suis]